MPSTRSKTKPKPSITLEFDAIGTSWRIQYVGDELQAQAIALLISDRITTFDATYSRFRTDSLIMQLSQLAGTISMPTDFDAMHALYEQLYRATNGLMTPLVGAVLSDAGYDTAYSFEPKRFEPAARWQDVLQYDYSSRQLNASQPVTLDYGAAGKGYLVDILGGLLLSQGIADYMIDASGDIALRSDQPRYIGLEDPSDVTKVIGLVELTGGRSLAGSAGNRRVWREYSHIMNPYTRESSSRIAATWVVADTTILADGLATALYFASPADLAEFSFEYVVLFTDGSRDVSPGFPARFFDQSMPYTLAV